VEYDMTIGPKKQIIYICNKCECLDIDLEDSGCYNVACCNHLNMEHKYIQDYKVAMYVETPQ
jgi:hypothetical protein